MRRSGMRRLAVLAIGITALLVSIFAASALADATTDRPFNRPVPGLRAATVGIASTPTGRGYWLAAADGGVFTYGDAPFLGSAGNLSLNQPVVGMAATPSGTGYWLVAADGGIFTYGTAPFRGSTGGVPLSAPIVGMASSQTGDGYWLVSSDGTVYSFGDAQYHGSARALGLNQPIVGMASTPTGNGYWLVAADGGVFTFGNATFRGSAGSIRLNQPIVDMAATASGNGYWLVAADGGVFTYGDAPFLGAGVGCVGNVATGIASRNGDYWIAAGDAGTQAFAQDGTSCTPPPVPVESKEQRIAREMFNKLNGERVNRGLPTLTWDTALAQRATEWSSAMGNGEGFHHSSLQPLIGRFSIAAENIGTGPLGVTSGAMHVAWMQSTTHRVNLLAPNLEVVGIGVVCAPDGTMWATQNFGRFPTSALPWDFGPTPAQDPIAQPDRGGATCR
ncbi:MAG: CAP domain-containing protein [Acidimicrobiia bacterium]